MRKTILGLWALLLLTGNLFAKADRSLVEEYMEISGATQTIESLSSQVVSGIKETSAIYGKKVDHKAINKMEKIFAPKESLKSVKEVLTDRFDNESLLEILKFYHSKIGQELTQANLDAIQNSTQSDMLRFVASLRENPPSKKRAETINRYIDALGSDKILEDLFFEMFDYLSQKSTKKERMSNKKRSQFMQMLQQSFEQQLFLSTMFIYQDISDEDIDKATDYLNSLEGKKEKSVVREAIRKMIKDGLKRAL